LEKRNYANKHITQLNISGNIIHNPTEILNHEQHFYEKLYMENDIGENVEENITKLLKHINTPQLTVSQKEHCELQVDTTE
jgi:hypothetical protein